MRTSLFIIFLSAILFSGCEKTVSFNLNDVEPELVVDASIEDGQPPVIILSNSFNYFSEISPEILLNSFVHGAEITISNGTTTQKLKEYSRDFLPGIKIYYY